MPRDVSFVVSVFLLGGASGSLLASLWHIAVRRSIRDRFASELQRALFKKRRSSTAPNPTADVRRSISNVHWHGM